MRRIAGCFVGLLIIVVAGCGGKSEPQYDLFKPVTCTEKGCHDKWFKENAVNEVHQVFNPDGCRDCHRPHGRIPVLLLSRDGDALCTECHAPEPVPKGGSAHHGDGTPGCVTCHEPHAAERSPLLRSNQEQLCIDCHSSILETKQHEDGQPERACLSCHQAHPSPRWNLLNNKPNPCVACHSGSDEMMTKAHFGRVLNTGCLECHAPHNSSKDKFMLKVQHAPAEQGECGICHSEDSQVLNDEATALCVACHDSAFPEMTARHEGNVTGCLDCHHAHASSRERLLRETPETLCGSCHADILGEKPRRIHSSEMSLSCIDCHNLHQKAKWSVPEKQAEACSNCHSDMPSVHRSHIPDTQAPCTTCHDPHSSEERLMTAGVRQTCTKCHTGDEFSQRYGHNEHAKLDCLNCHREHGEDGVLKAEVSALCTECHQTPMDTAMKSLHLPYEAKECLLCHQKHTSSERELLKSRGADLCTDCHDRETGSFVHEPYNHDCLACHNGHWSKQEALLKYSGAMQCYKCHENVRRAVMNADQFSHLPATEGECRLCHTAHTAENPALLMKNGAALCTDCHDLEDDTLIKAHGGLNIAEAECRECHNPHASPINGLLHPNSHQSFLKGECKDCHE